MPFTVDDFEDLIRLLEERPDWRARLRDLLLPREILELPAAIAELARISREALERLDRLEGRMAGLEDGQAEIKGRLTGVEGDVRGLKTDMDEVKAALRRLENAVGEVRGSGWEIRFRADPEYWATRLIDQPVSLSARQVRELLAGFVAEGRLTPAEASHVRRADLIVAGTVDGDPAFLLMEVSRIVHESDVQRAADRAILLRKAASRVRPVVGGKLIRADAVELARQRNVEIDADELPLGAQVDD